MKTPLPQSLNLKFNIKSQNFNGLNLETLILFTLNANQILFSIV